MTCSEFNDLDEATRLAVIRAILAQENNILGPDNEEVAQIACRGGLPVPARRHGQRGADGRRAAVSD